MNTEQKKEITKLSKWFASAFKDTVGDIAGSGWLIVDPLSGYLNSCGYENKLHQIPAKDGMPMILIMEFKDGSQFIPAGSNFKFVHKKSKDWMWL